MEITKKPLSLHITKKQNRSIKYIVLHYTAGSTSKKGSADNVRNVFLKSKASSDFVVDDGTILQLNPDINNYYCWHCGDKKYPYSKGGTLYGKCTNSNSIGIEICSNLKKGTTAKVPNHSGWYYTQSTLDNVVELVKELMKKYNIPIENVVRHFDVSGKSCPGIAGYNDEIMYDEVTGKPNGKRNNSTEWLKLKSLFKS